MKRRTLLAIVLLLGIPSCCAGQRGLPRGSTCSPWPIIPSPPENGLVPIKPAPPVPMPQPQPPASKAQPSAPEPPKSAKDDIDRSLEGYPIVRVDELRMQLINDLGPRIDTAIHDALSGDRIGLVVAKLHGSQLPWLIQVTPSTSS